jgi:hypothetical protein
MDWSHVPQHPVRRAIPQDEQQRKFSTVAEAAKVLFEAGKANIFGVEVPIHYYDVQGQDWQVNYPSLTYECINIQPRYTGGEYRQPRYGEYDFEDYAEPVAEGTIEVDGETLTGNVLYRRRKVEQPYDFYVEIRAYAKDPVMTDALIRHVSRVLPPRTFLRVPMIDGSYRSWDVQQSAFQDLDKREAIASGRRGFEREYLKLWNFRVEGYLDTSDDSEYVNAVRERLITLGRYTVGV